MIERVLAGEEIVISKAGKLVTRLVPYETDFSDQISGMDEGKFVIQPDFDKPLNQFDQ